jgi:hypothetical protein
VHPKLRDEISRLARLARTFGVELDELLQLFRDEFTRGGDPVTPGSGDVLPGPPPAALGTPDVMAT